MRPDQLTILALAQPALWQFVQVALQHNPVLVEKETAQDDCCGPEQIQDGPDEHAALVLLGYAARGAKAVSTPGEASALLPDVLVQRNDEGGHDVRVPDEWLPQIGVSRRCVELWRDESTADATRGHLGRMIGAAALVAHGMELRRRVLEAVSRAILRHQEAFLQGGRIRRMKPEQVAEAAGVSDAAVRAAVASKWLQTDHGLFLLTSFVAASWLAGEGDPLRN
jgi:DNA-directed RNA polymerase specialized sigma54-like protein